MFCSQTPISYDGGLAGVHELHEGVAFRLIVLINNSNNSTN